MRHVAAGRILIEGGPCCDSCLQWAGQQLDELDAAGGSGSTAGEPEAPAAASARSYHTHACHTCIVAASVLQSTYTHWWKMLPYATRSNEMR